MAHYYDQDQDSEFKICKIELNILNLRFDFCVSGGVFSSKGLDKGTELLIKSSIIKDKWKILDFGCGWGAVGIVIGKMHPNIEIMMIDVNKRAVKLAGMNIKVNQIRNAKVFFSNYYEDIQGKFDTILVNPPQVAGKESCFKIIEESKQYLEKNGLLQLVARHNKGGLSYSNKMMEVFGNVKDIAKKSGYRVYVSKFL